MQLGFYLQPAPPEPEFITKEFHGDMIYGWSCDKDGICVYGDSKKEAVANWQDAHFAEYGQSVH